MPKYVINNITVSEDGEVVAGPTYGPYNSHAEANGAMQPLFDETREHEDYEGFDSDDSEASHFYITNGLGASVNWFVTPLEPC